MNITEKITEAKELEFVIFCIENIAQQLNVNAEIVYKKLSESNIITEYIVPCFEALHTQSREYIIDDILDVMEERDVKI